MPLTGSRARSDKALLVIPAIVLAAFAVTVPMREPWRCHLAKGDQWVTGQALRWLRTWARDGAWELRFALVLSPPTADYQGDRKLLKWALPGHPMLVHGVLLVLGLEPDVGRLMWVNLGIHLTLALLLSLLAYFLARNAWPEHPIAAVLVGCHCGVFVLLLPAILYWGQSLSCQSFTVVPLFVFFTAGRWLRVWAPPGRMRTSIDAAVAASVFCGTLTDFLFWLVVPYSLAARSLRAWTDRPRTTDPWAWTVGLPFVLSMSLLILVFAQSDLLGAMLERFSSWMSIDRFGDGAGFDPASMGLSKLFFVAVFLFGHFAGAFAAIGSICLALAAFWTLPRWGRRRMNPEARGLLLDLALPPVLFVLALAPHQAHHTFSAMKWVPFVALMWTVFTPMIIVPRPKLLRVPLFAGYGLLSLTALAPLTNPYWEYFAEPEMDWDREASLLREHSDPGDRIFSPTTEILILPPQRIALAERAVHRAYGPLDVLRGTERLASNRAIAIYGPGELHAALGATGAQSMGQGDLSLTRIPRSRFQAFLAARADATYRENIGETLSGEFVAAETELRPYASPVAPLDLPIAMHVTFALEGAFEQARLYWENDRRFHWETDRRRHIALGDDSYEGQWIGTWQRGESRDEAPARWGRFIVQLFLTAGEMAERGEVSAFSWRGYDVIPLPVETLPDLVAARVASSAASRAFLVFGGETPVAVVVRVGPEGTGNWVSVAFDEMVGRVSAPDYVAERWAVRKRGAAVDGDQAD